MDKLTLPAPAKLNRFLHVIGRRDDGYHLLQTIFHFIDFSDQLRFCRRKDNKITITVNNASISNQQNLAYRAATLLQKSSSTNHGVDITIDKKIPLGGGLGGGSSDAATTLHALNLLWELDLSEAQLIQIGLQIGADVPVFVHGQSAWAEGIGERLTPIELPSVWFVVLNPQQPIDTAEIFCHAKLPRNTPFYEISADLIDSGHNDCEKIVRRRYPEINKALSWLNKFAPARLTGTGGCIFAAFDQVNDALDVLEQLPEQFSGFIAQGINQSPLLNAIKRYTIAASDDV